MKFNKELEISGFATIIKLKKKPIKIVGSKGNLRLYFLDDNPYVIGDMDLKRGQLCVLLSPGMRTPRNKPFRFMKRYNYLVKPRSIGGYYSYGIILPLSYIKKYLPAEVYEGLKPYDDITYYLYTSPPVPKTIYSSHKRCISLIESIVESYNLWSDVHPPSLLAQTENLFKFQSSVEKLLANEGLIKSERYNSFVSFRKD